MKSLRVLLVSTLSMVFAMGLVACGGGGGSSTSFSLNDYIPLAVGNTWTYNETVDGVSASATETITGTETLNGTNTFVQTDSDGDTIWRSQDSSGTYEHKILFSDGDTIVYPTPWQGFVNTISTGETKVNTSPFTWTISGIVYTGTASDSYKLVGSGDLNVPAGTFKGCLKLSGKATLKMDNGVNININYTYWLASGVGTVKYTSTTSKGSTSISRTEELVSYSVASTPAKTLSSYGLNKNLDAPDRDIESKLRKILGK